MLKPTESHYPFYLVICEGYHAYTDGQLLLVCQPYRTWLYLMFVVAFIQYCIALVKLCSHIEKFSKLLMETNKKL